MPTCIAFLRAVNVTGRFVRMTVPADAFRVLGHVDARTHIPSGDVVFTTARRPTPPLARAIEDGLAPRLGFRSEVFPRTAAGLRAGMLSGLVATL